MEAAIANFATTGDEKTLVKAIKKHYGLKSVHKKALPYLLNKLDLNGPLNLEPFEKSWKNCRTYKDIFSRFGDSLFPALCIGGDGYGIEFWFVLTTGTVISLHHDASFFEVASHISAKDEADFVKKFAKAGAAFTIEQLASLQQMTATLEGSAQEKEQAFFIAAAKALGLTWRRLAKKLKELSLEFVYSRCRGFIDERLDDFLAAEKKLKALGKLKGKTKKKIELSYCFLQELPAELAEVKGCEELDLSGNAFSDLSTLRTECERMGVKRLDLSLCSLATIPPLPASLEAVDISENDLDEEAIDELRKTMAGCAIRNKVDTFSPLNASLDLSFRNLKKLPRGFEKMTNLEELDLRGNPRLDFVTVFDTLANYKIKKLDLRFCKLSKLPDNLNKMIHLEELVCDNERHFAHRGKENTIALNELMPQLATLPNIRNLDLSKYRKSIELLPDWLAAFKKLEKLTFAVDKYGDNAEKVKAVIEALSDSKELKELTVCGDMEADWLKGLGALAAVRRLTISGSYMKQVPLGICELSELEELSLFSNFESLPSDIKKLHKLRKLKIQGNQKPRLKLTEEFGQLRALEDFELLSTWTHSLPDTIGQLSSLKRIKVNSEGLNELPQSIGKLVSLEILDLYGCKMKSLPDSIGQLGELRVLDLADNYNLAALPETIGKLSKLEKLNIRNTALKELPDSFFDLDLRDLEVYSPHEDKYLSIDELLSQVHRFKNLERLSAKRFDKQKFELPATITELKSLKSLELCVGQMEELHTFGVISRLESLEHLDIAFYEFQAFPKAMEELKSLKEISVDLGKLSPETGSELFTRLAKLPSLKKVDCKWKGAKSLPKEIGLLRNVSELDFFQNQLKDVPDTILELTQLSLLDLRANSIPSAKIKTIKKALPDCEVLG